ncbi:Clavaminate synthase-like protein, partial [Aspergillus ellipticus CBS 707.79]
MSTTTTTTSPALNPNPTYHLTSLNPNFGAEIHGLDFANGVTDEDFRIVQDAVIKYGFIVLRNTKLTDETHLTLARKFGALDDVTPYNALGRKNRLRYDELFDVSNVELDGSVVDPRSPRGEANKGNTLFHVDSSFNPRRASYSLLLAHELPPPGTGGNTAFADTRTAYDALPPSLKTQLFENDYIAAHSIMHSRKLAAPEHFAHVDPWDYPMGRHRIVQRHEPSGRMNLYVAAHVHHLEGLGAADSKEVFGRVWAHVTQERFVVEVCWENVGDCVVWDNTATMHRAVTVEGGFEGRFRRDLRRATVHDG